MIGGCTTAVLALKDRSGFHKCFEVRACRHNSKYAFVPSVLRPVLNLGRGRRCRWRCLALEKASRNQFLLAAAGPSIATDERVQQWRAQTESLRPWSCDSPVQCSMSVGRLLEEARALHTQPQRSPATTCKSMRAAAHGTDRASSVRGGPPARRLGTRAGPSPRQAWRSTLDGGRRNRSGPIRSGGEAGGTRSDQRCPCPPCSAWTHS